MNSELLYAELIVYAELIISITMVIMTGIYFIFSNTIMPVLSKVENGALVMIAINKVILNPVFLTLFAVSALGALYLMIFGAGPTQLAAWVFFLGTVVVTVTRNIPMNNQLLNTENAAQLRQAQWQQYLIHWVRWNHIRSISSAVSAAILLI